MNCISNITQGSESPDKKSKSNSQMYLHDNSEVLLDESKKASPSKHTEQAKQIRLLQERNQKLNFSFIGCADLSSCNDSDFSESEGFIEKKAKTTSGN